MPIAPPAIGPTGASGTSGIAAQPSSVGLPPTSPANYLMAAADLHQSGQLSAPVPTGEALQTGKAKGRRAHIQVVK